ncbi:hypothetical protein BHM03_00033138, partial [Ensete ventricosum]
MRTGRYRAVPPKSIVDDRLREKKGRRRRRRRGKEERRREKDRNTSSPVATRERFFSHARRRNVSHVGRKIEA